MRKMLIIMLAVLAIALPACAEAGNFSFRNGIAWGMDQQAVREAESPANGESDHEAGFDVLEYGDVNQYDGICDIDYYIKDDALQACVCDYDTEDNPIDYQTLYGAMTAAWGAPIEYGDPERWRLMEDTLDGEMEDRPADSFASWELADGTFIALVEDARDASMRICFYDEMKLVEGSL